MSNLYELLVDLLGKEEKHPSFQKVLEAIKEPPFIQKHGGRYGTNYIFGKTGAEIWIRNNKFHSIGFSSHYEGELSRGIVFGDNLDSVRNKLGVASTPYSNYCFVLPPLNLWFSCIPHEESFCSLNVTLDEKFNYSVEGLTKGVPMIQVGYMAKFVNSKPDWLEGSHIIDSYAVNDHVSEDFTGWNHLVNIHHFFDSPQIIEQAANEDRLSLAGTKLFYYEEYAFEYDETENNWEEILSEDSALMSPHNFKPEVVMPENALLEGFDISSYKYNPECSALSCSNLASKAPTNKHCLITSFEEAKSFLETYYPDEKEFNRFGEDGPYRIYAVYSIPWKYDSMERESAD